MLVVFVWAMHLEQPRHHVVVEVVVVPDAEEYAHGAHQKRLYSPDIRENVKSRVAISHYGSKVKAHLNADVHLHVINLLVGPNLMLLNIEDMVTSDLSHIIQVNILVLQDYICFGYLIRELLAHLGIDL